MNYALILGNIAAFAIALGALLPRLLSRWGGIGYKLSSVCFFTVILCEAIALQYEFTVSAVIIIALAAVLLFMSGWIIGTKPWVKKED